ncbi:MAG: hypothetical protein RSF67_08365 [Clostridia bacterium]
MYFDIFILTHNRKSDVSMRKDITINNQINRDEKMINFNEKDIKKLRELDNVDLNKFIDKMNNFQLEKEDEIAFYEVLSEYSTYYLGDNYLTTEESKIIDSLIDYILEFDKKS